MSVSAVLVDRTGNETRIEGLCAYMVQATHQPCSLELLVEHNAQPLALILRSDTLQGKLFLPVRVEGKVALSGAAESEQPGRVEES